MEGTFCLSSILCIVWRQNSGKKKLAGYFVEVQTGNLSARACTGLQGLQTFKTSVLKKREVLPGKMVVWMLHCLLEQVLPLLVATYENHKRVKPSSSQPQVQVIKRFVLLSKLLPCLPSYVSCQVFLWLAAVLVTAILAVAIPGSSTENAIYVG